MKAFFTLVLFLISSLALAQSNDERLGHITNLKRIAFGSCNDQNDAQPLWRSIMKTEPDLWIWGGDAIYADWDKSLLTVKRAYEKQNAKEDYIAFKQQVPIIGTWDDHDYAHDNANGNLSYKKGTQQLFLDFVEEPAASPRRTQDGIYTSYEFGDEAKKVKIILLDNRYFKGLDKNAPMLGMDQWRWFEEQIKGSTASVHFIVTGLSVFSLLLPYTEEWAESWTDLQRMLSLLEKHKPKGVVFLTGDKHFASIFRYYGPIEFMASGMTHVAPRKTWWYLARKFPRVFFGLNYGLIDINWEGMDNTPVIDLAVRGVYDRDIMRLRYRWDNEDWKQIPIGK